MPVHIEELTSEVTAIDGDLPLTDDQVERIVDRVLRRLAERQRGARPLAEIARMRPGVARLTPADGEPWP